MSEASYQLNVQRGVTGSHSGTCLLASYDRLSATTGIKTETYEVYDWLRELFASTVGDHANHTPEEIDRQFRRVEIDFRRQLGVLTSRNIIYARVDTESSLRTALIKLGQGGFRTAVHLDVGGLHTVGVSPLDDDTYEIKSTWSPFDNEGVSTSELFRYLDRAPRQRRKPTGSKRTGVARNIVALPAEPAGCKPTYPHI